MCVASLYVIYSMFLTVTQAGVVFIFNLYSLDSVNPFGLFLLFLRFQSTDIYVYIYIKEKTKQNSEQCHEHRKMCVCLFECICPVRCFGIT